MIYCESDADSKATALFLTQLKRKLDSGERKRTFREFEEFSFSNLDSNSTYSDREESATPESTQFLTHFNEKEQLINKQGKRIRVKLSTNADKISRGQKKQEENVKKFLIFADSEI